MRTRVLLALLLAAALGAPAAARADSHVEVDVTKCKTGSRSKDRSATFKAIMRSVSGTDHMAMRFKLLAQTEGPGSGGGSASGSQAVASSKFAVWHKSHSDVARYVYSQTVKRLKQGTSYRMRVKFRWYDADGNVIRKISRLSPACAQEPRARPNLRVSAVSAFPGPAPGTAIYAVSVANPGEGPADAFTVALFVDGGLADSRTIEGLDSGESATIDLNGPACRRMSAVADSEHAIAETDEDDNALVSSC